MNRTTQFDKLVKISPYPVKIEPTALQYIGCFWYGDKGGQKPYEQKDFHPRIGISPYTKSQAQKIATLIHEIGHAIHYRRHCRCYTDHENRFLAEYHAERFALQFMLRYKLKGALQFEINDLDHNFHKFSQQWQKVIIQIRQEKIWIKCLRYLAQ